MKKLIEKSKTFFTKPQESILSAASIIMIMIVFARVLGLIRLRILAHFFVDESLTLYFASFRLPELVFEVLTLGALSSAFIPVFTKAYKRDPEEAWDVASRTVNIGLVLFVLLSIIFSISAENIYHYIAPGFTNFQTKQISYLARVIFAAQGFFVVSYAMTGVLESRRRFLVPALAPLFYNLGIILGTLLFARNMGLLAPALGVLIGASSHFIIQLPFAYNLGFRFKLGIRPTSEVKKIGKLALPRVFELLILQISKMAELFLASLITLASYTHYTLAISAQAVPVGLFGLSMAKASLPILSSQSEEPDAFKKTLLSTLYQVLFFVIPIAGFIIVLRIPIIRLLFGADIFGWEATVQTGLVLSAFAIGIPFQTSVLVLTRAFYALHDTKTPVKVSLVGTFISVTLGFLFVLQFGFSTWGLALAYSLGQIFQGIALFYLVSKKLNNGTFFAFTPITKSILATTVASVVMYFFLKIFDRSVWVKQLSFLGSVRGFENINFERFVLDTRFTVNLIILSGLTTLLGTLIYIALSFLMQSKELAVLVQTVRKHALEKPAKKEETISPITGDTSQV